MTELEKWIERHTNNEFGDIMPHNGFQSQDIVSLVCAIANDLYVNREDGFKPVVCVKQTCERCDKWRRLKEIEEDEALDEE